MSKVRWKRRFKVAAALTAAIYLLPVLAAAALHLSRGEQAHWSRADRTSIGLASDPAATPEAMVQVYAARTYGWRSIFGVHTWVAVKPAGAPAWERLEVVGFGVNRGRPAVRISEGMPDTRWFGNNPWLLGQARGAIAESAIPRLRAAAADYPYGHQYTVWPGPNSNTFVAHLLRRAPELQVDLPATAIGKNYLVEGVVAPTPSGTGWQFSLGGVVGIALGAVEGIEIDLLGLGAGLDFKRPALRLPGLGRLGIGMANGLDSRS